VAEVFTAMRVKEDAYTTIRGGIPTMITRGSQLCVVTICDLGNNGDTRFVKFPVASDADRFRVAFLRQLFENGEQSVADVDEVGLRKLLKR
jgi:hypothetical protein